MINLQQTKKALQAGLGRPHDGKCTPVRTGIAYVIPAAIGALSYWTQPKFDSAGLLAGEAILTGALFGLAVLGYDRVRDLRESGTPAGIDPMQAAVRFAKATLAATYISIAVSALIVVAMVIDLPADASRTGYAILAALITHQFVRLWFLVGALRHQIGATAGSRAGVS